MQTLSAGLYIYGFAEGWAFVFPEHPRWAVVLVVYVVGMLVTSFDQRIAYRIQMVVLLLLIGALVSMALGLREVEELHSPAWIGRFEDGSFWLMFAVFFPAASGIMVGVSMSGQLKEPRRSIPVGVMGAWAVSLAIYAVTMVWYAVVASPEELRSNYLVSIQYAAVPMLVQLGLLACCTSAMLGSMLAAPQILFALGQHRLIPRGAFFAQATADGQYRNASLVTGALLGLVLLVGDLNRIAQLITMFFLITYATLNIVLLIEQSLALISFRPTFRVPLWVPLLGAVSCVFAMVITAPTFGLIALTVVVGIYFTLANQQLDTPWETVRSGIFLALADWAAKRTQRFRERFERAWKPDILVPITRTSDIDGRYRLLRSLAWPKGSVQVLAVQTPAERCDAERLRDVVHEFQHEDLFTTFAELEAPSVADGVAMGMAVMQGSFFRPNILFVDASRHSQDELQRMLDLARRYEMGCAVLMPHPVAGMGHERRVNVWVRDQSPNWELGLRLANIDLTLLLAYQLNRSWKGQLRMLSVVADPAHVEEADHHLRQIYRDARIPGLDLSWVRAGRFQELVGEAPHADLNLFGLSPRANVQSMRDLCEQTGSSCLFVLDSGYESAFA